MNNKYVKTSSLTWWACFVPILAGIFLATEHLHQLHDWVLVVNQMTGGITPAVLINSGLVGIGVRGAIK